MVGLGEEMQFLFAAADAGEELLDALGRDENVVGGVDDEHGDGDLRRGIEAAANELEEAFEEAEGEGIDFVRGGLEPAAMGFVARDPFFRDVAVALGVPADVNAMGGAGPAERSGRPPFATNRDCPE